jgi:hypothetical protein
VCGAPEKVTLFLIYMSLSNQNTQEPGKDTVFSESEKIAILLCCEVGELLDPDLNLQPTCLM